MVGVERLYRASNGRDGPVLWFLLLWIASSGVLSFIYTSVGSEAPFLAAVVWTMVLAERWRRLPTIGLGIGVWATAAAAVTYRYVGVALLAALVIWCFQVRWPPRRALGAAAAFASSVIPVALWYVFVATAQSADHYTAPDRTTTVHDFFHSLGALGSLPVGLLYTENQTIVLRSIDPVVRFGLALVGVALVVAAVWFLVRQWRRSGTSLVDGLRSRRAAPLLLSIDYALISIALLAVWRFSIGYHIIARYWLAALIPVIAGVAARLSVRVPASPSKGVRTVGLGLMGLVILGNLALTLHGLV